MTVKIPPIIASVLAGLCVSTAVLAADAYDPVPAGDVQYGQCLAYSATVYQGGNDASPIAGQNKAQAWCTCMWQETPEDFKGSLAKFSETPKGAATNKTCERYANWQ
jgi:hypothetical protein